ncbi:hypothetical protein [Actinomadura litoris]|uniref:hypothetical protein n=1 Tax=Actinomadura litoris TaxID=2678616 RepID=UPI001FA772DC|nr:hypothetical protein [Actinomadura litoris]
MAVPAEGRLAASTEETAVYRDVTVRVRSLLAAAFLPASEKQIAGLVASYAAARPGVDGLFDVPEARYASPVLERRVSTRPGERDEEPA